MRKLFFKARTGVVLILVLLFIGISIAEGEQGKIPITTSSEQAREFYLKGQQMDDNLRNQEARVFYKKALEADPDFALAHLYLAISEVTFTDYFDGLDRAKALMDQVSDGEKLLIQSSDININNNPMEVRKILTKLVEMYTGDERAQTFLAGNYYGQQEYEEAIKHYNEAININSAYAPAYNMIGYSYWQIEKLDEAEKAFKKYIELIPDDPNPYDSYAELLLKMGRFDESIEHYQKALNLDPVFTVSRFGIATNLCMKGDYNTAHAQIDTVYDKAKEDGDRRAALTARAAVFSDEGNLKMALDMIQKRHEIALAANDTITMGNDIATMGFILFEMGEYDKAALKYTDSKNMIVNADVKPTIKDQANANYLYNIARIFLKDGKFNKAKNNAEEYMYYAGKIQNLNSKRLAHQLIGMIAFEEKNFKRAVAELKQSNLLNPYNIYRLALAYNGKGEVDKAKELYAKAANFNAVNSLNYSLIRKKAAGKLE